MKPKVKIKNNVVKTPTGGTYQPAAAPSKPKRSDLFSFNATNMTANSISPLVKTHRIPQVFYTDLAWNKIWHFVDMCDKEIGWLGIVSITDNGDYVIDDVYLPEQVVTGTTTDIESDAVGNLAVELECAGIDSSRLRYWGHSHVEMAVSPSGTDEAQVSEYLEHCNYFIRGIYNKKRDTKVDIFNVDRCLVYQKVNNGLIPSAEDNELSKSIKQEIANKVKHPPPPAALKPNYSPGYYPGYARQSSMWYEDDDKFDQPYKPYGGKKWPY